MALFIEFDDLQRGSDVWRETFFVHHLGDGCATDHAGVRGHTLLARANVFISG